MRILTCSIWITPLLALRLAHAAAEEPLRSLEAKLHHLRSGSQAEWQEYADKTPEGQRLEITFAAPVNERESTLFIRRVCSRTLSINPSPMTRHFSPSPFTDAAKPPGTR